MIVEGILIALAHIEDVIKTIRSSASTKEAIINLCNDYQLNEEQAKAIVDIKLGRLAHMESDKFKKEKSDLEETKRNLSSLIIL